MDKKRSNDRNYVSYLVILIFVGFIFTMVSIIAKPEIKVGDNVSLQKTPIALELGIVDCDCDRLYLFDQTRKKLTVYNNDGISIENYDFSFSGTVKIVDIDEVDHQLTVYYYRVHKFYVIDFSGEVISIIDDDIGYVDNYLKVNNEVGSYKIENNFFWYSIQQDEAVLINRISYMPFIVAAVLIFFGGMIVSLRRYKGVRADT